MEHFIKLLIQFNAPLRFKKKCSWCARIGNSFLYDKEHLKNLKLKLYLIEKCWISFSVIRNKAHMSTLTTYFPHFCWNSRQCNKASKKIESIKIRKSSKTDFISDGNVHLKNYRNYWNEHMHLEIFQATGSIHKNSYSQLWWPSS